MSSPNDQTYSFDQEELRCHIKAVKRIGVTGMIIVLLSTPLFVLASMNWSNYHPVDYEVKVNVNETACSYLKQFDLKDRVMLSVCNRDGEIIFDIRLFINQTATIRGIPLNLSNGMLSSEYPPVWIEPSKKRLKKEMVCKNV